MRRALMILIMQSFMGAVQAGGLDIYLVSHAETLNPSGTNYCDSCNMLSERGIEQVKSLTNKLKAPHLHFDAVLVSSAPRAINTILPYLKESGIRGEIWPEIAECCWQKDHGNIAEGKLIPTSTVRLSLEQETYLTFRDTYSTRDYGNLNYADGVAHVHRAEELLKQRYFESGKTILIVAHSHSGQLMLADLLGTTPDSLPHLEDGKLTHLYQDDDGRFKLMSINDEDILSTPGQ